VLQSVIRKTGGARRPEGGCRARAGGIQRREQKAIEIPAGRANQLKKFYRQMAADVGAQVAGLSARQWLYC